MLAGLGGGGDANHLARASLKDQEVANADVMARDGDGVGRHAARCDGHNRRRGGSRHTWERWFGVSFLDDYLLTVVVVMVVVAASVDGMQDTVSSFVETVTERMIVTVLVVVAHITLELLGGIDGGAGVYLNSLGWLSVTLLGEVLGGLTVACLRVFWGGLRGEAGFGSVLGLLAVAWLSALTVVSFGFVDLGWGVLGGWAVNGTELAVVCTLLDGRIGSLVGPVLDVDLSLSVPSVRFVVAEVEEGCQLLPNRMTRMRWKVTVEVEKKRSVAWTAEDNALARASLALD